MIRTYVRKVSWLESERNGEKLSAYCYTIKQAAIFLQEAPPCVPRTGFYNFDIERISF